MKKATSFLTAATLAGLSQFGLAQQHGQLRLNSTDIGESGTNVYFAGSVNMSFAPDTTSTYGPTFQAYCTVLNVDAYIGSAWGATQLDTTDFVPSPNSGAVNPSNWQQVGSEIAWLADSYGITSNNEQAAATQVAIWDLAEGGDGTAHDVLFDPVTGEIHTWVFGDNTISDAMGMAFNAVQAYDGGARDTETWYQADVNANGIHVSQDFVTPGHPPTATPEPFTLGLGIAGIGFAVRRRRARQAV